MTTQGLLGKVISLVLVIVIAQVNSTYFTTIILTLIFINNCSLFM